MPVFLYVGAPTFLGAALFVLITRLFAQMIAGNTQLRYSTFLGWVQVIAAFIAVIATSLNPISGFACNWAIYGFYLSILVAMVDWLNLIWWGFQSQKEGSQTPMMHAIAFTLLRLAVHGLLTAGFLWAALMCTV